MYADHTPHPPRVWSHSLPQSLPSSSIKPLSSLLQNILSGWTPPSPNISPFSVSSSSPESFLNISMAITSLSSLSFNPDRPLLLFSSSNGPSSSSSSFFTGGTHFRTQKSLACVYLPSSSLSSKRVSVVVAASSDYYSTLGVPKSANSKEIKAAYRKLARQVFYPFGGYLGFSLFTGLCLVVEKMPQKRREGKEMLNFCQFLFYVILVWGESGRLVGSCVVCLLGC